MPSPHAPPGAPEAPPPPSLATPDAAELYELAYYRERGPDLPLVEFLAALIDRYGAQGEVLDCACGTGEPALWLADRYRITLADASEAMVRAARAKVEQAGLCGVSVHQATWSTLPQNFDRRFSAILCTGNALALAPTRDERRAALRGMYAVTAMGGMVYADFREDYGDVPAGRLGLSEVAGPLAWDGGNLALLVYEGRFSPHVYRTKDFVRGGPGSASVVASLTTRYLPFTHDEIRNDLLEVGFGEPVFHTRPGAWPLAAITATRSQ